jgi:hypothetical protein
MEARRNPKARCRITIKRDRVKMPGKQSAMRAAVAWSVFCYAAVLLSTSANAQSKATLINGSLYRVHPGFLEVQTGGKKISLVKVNAATIYWNGKTDKKATAKELQLGDEVIIEAAEKDGIPVAQKVRFAHTGNS